MAVAPEGEVGVCPEGTTGLSPGFQPRDKCKLWSALISGRQIVRFQCWEMDNPGFLERATIEDEDDDEHENDCRGPCDCYRTTSK